METNLSAQMLGASEQLAASIEAGELDALTVHQRFQLRWLALGLAAWSDLVETMEAAEAAQIRRRTDRRLWRAAALIWSVNGAAVAVVGLILALR